MFPVMVLPQTMTLYSSVNVSGSTIEIFQDTALPLTVPSTMGPDRPSADCSPVSVLPSAIGFHVCAPFKFNGQPDRLYCVVVPPEI